MNIFERLFGSGVRSEPDKKEIGRNDLCWCGSGKKYKKCHLAKDERKAHATFEKHRRV